MNRVLKEPLLHFFALAALLFVSYDALNRNAAPEPEQIVISQGQLAQMLEGFERTRQRLPTQDEWDGLIEDRVKEEVYYREALALGMDKDDIIIRRRLQQKMEFVSNDIAAPTPPTDADLNAYLQARPDQYRVESQFTFRHIYLAPEKHGANLVSDAAQLLATLNQPAGDTGWESLGDAFVIERNFTALPISEVNRQFGDHFSVALRDIQTGRWQGPIESAFGMHLVFVSERTQSRIPALADVRDAVRRDWEDQQRQQANATFYQDLLKQYSVSVEAFVPGAGERKVTASQ